MATLVCNGNINASSSSWKVVHAGSLLDSESNNTALTTSYVSSSTFSLDGSTAIEGVCVKIASRAASPTGTMSVRLFDGSNPVANTTVTINVSDLQACSSASQPASAGEGGWYFFKFATPVTPPNASTYTVQATTSSSSQVNLYRDGTSNNWSRMLVTSTTASAGAADLLHLPCEVTGQGTGSSYTLTWDITATTIFGTVNTTGSITVGNRMTLLWGSSASTAYYMKIAGFIRVFSGGTWSQGTSGTRIPSTSSATLQFAITTNVDGGFIAHNGSTINRYGNVVTTVKTVLNTDEAVSSTVLGVASTSGWANGDEIVIGTTTQTYSQCEKRTISTVDSGTQVTVTSGLTYAHSGTSPTQAPVIHLTRNVKVIGTSSSLQGFVYYGNTAVVNDSYVQFTNLGSGTSNKRGVGVDTTTGSFTAVGCSYHDGIVGSSMGVFTTQAVSNNISVTYCVFHNIASTALYQVATTGASVTIDNCYVVGFLGAAFNVQDVGITFTNNLACGCSGYGITINESAVVTGTFSGLSAHGNSSGGISISNVWGGTIGINTAWRNDGNGGVYLRACSNLSITSAIVFGNNSNNVNFQFCAGVRFDSFVVNGDTTFATSYGVYFYGSFGTVASNSSFGAVSGIKTSHNVADCFNNYIGALTLLDCLLSSSTEVLMTSAPPGPLNYVVSQKHDNTAGLHKRWHREGQACPDTTTYRTASPSELLAPAWTTTKLWSSPKAVKVASGGFVTATVYVYKSNENLLTYSTDFSNAAWQNYNVTRTGGQSDPFSGTSAHSLVEENSSAHHGYARATNVSVSNGATYTTSCYVKSYGGRQWVRLVDDQSGRNTWFDIVNGTVGTTDAAHTASITDVGGGWYRLAITFTTQDASNTPAIYSATADGALSTFAGDVAKGFYLYGFQIVTGSSLLQYLATTTPAVTGYNGAQPRLMLRANAAAGIDSDVVIATASGELGSWLTLSGSSPTVNDDCELEFYVDCDGTAGTVNVSDWSVSGDYTGTVEKCWSDGRASRALATASTGGGTVIYAA